jgi:hypothetical protein
MPDTVTFQDCVPSLSLGVFARLEESMMQIDNLDLGLITSTIGILDPDNPLGIQTLEAVQVRPRSYSSSKLQFKLKD